MKLTPAEQRLVDGQTWSDFCDDLKQIGNQIMRPEAPADPFSRAEGFRYLTRVLRSSLDIFVEHADPDFPRLYRVCDEVIKYGGDNPDNYYEKCVVAGDRRYRIRGTRGTIPYVSFLTQGSNFAEGESMLPTGFLDSKNILVEPDGTFEIIISAEKQPGNWLPMTASSQALLIRQTFNNRDQEEIAKLNIECLDAPDIPRPLDPNEFDRGMKTATQFLEGTVELFCDWSAKYQGHPNDVPKEDQELCRRVGGDPNICYYNSYWQLEDDEALIIEIPRIPKCENWNFELCNYWMESLDYRYQKIHVNNATAHRETDGSVRIVVAHQDPGHPNWLSTAGHQNGTMLFRWIGAEEHIDPVARVIKTDAFPR